MKIRTLILISGSLCLASAETAAPAQVNRIASGRAVQLDLKGVSSEEASRFRGLYPVSETGVITLPNLPAPVRAAGLTPAELGHAIEAAYRAAAIYKDPTVLVIADGSQQPDELTVTIGGQVKKAGPVKYSPSMTLYQAVEAGGGATEFGSMRRVILIREGKSQTVDLTKNETKNLLVKPNDTLEVPEKSPFGGG